MSMDLMCLAKMVLFVTSEYVDFSVWIGDFGCSHPILTRVWRMGTIVLEVMNRPASLALAAEDIKI